MTESQLIGQRVADDGTRFGEDEFHRPCFRRPGEDADRDALAGHWLTVDGRRWEVIEDRTSPSGLRWSEIGGAR
jgi:hypothetical protein